MMKEYIDKTADVQFLRAQIPTLVQEMEFFEQRRSVEVERDGKTYTLFTFGTGKTTFYFKILPHDGSSL